MKIDGDSLRHFESIQKRRAALPPAPSIEQMRRFEQETKNLMTTGIIPVSDVSDISVPTRAASLPARTYQDKPGKDKPCLLWFHGGGHVLGTLDSNDDLCRLIASTLDMLVIGATYRLAPEHPFPAAFNDAIDVTSYVLANSEQLGIDPQRFAIGGASAGGNLAAAVCQHDRQAHRFSIRRQVLVYPVLDMTFSSKAHETFSDGYQLTSEMMRWFRQHYVPSGVAFDDPRLSPLYVEQCSDLPPAHIITAELDPVRSDGESYAARLSEAGVDVDFARYEGVMHGFFSDFPVVQKGRLAVAEVCAGLKSAFNL